MSTVRSRRATIDMAMCHLVKEALDDGWSAATAALGLWALVGNDLVVLHHLRARLCRAAALGQSELARRALATLDVALVGSRPPALLGPV